MIWPHNTGSFSGKTNYACGGSPVSRDSRRPRHPRALDDEEQNPLRTGMTAKYKGLIKNNVDFSG